MQGKVLGNYDIAIIGAGHAGCEAALASARMGKKTLLLCINLESVANMFCNPAIGGTGKGHLVREIDALGGQMGLVIDKTFMQSRMLNTAKGPAVHSLRAQADKLAYHLEMKRVLEREKNLDLKQAEVTDIVISEEGDGKVVKGVLTATGSFYSAKIVIVATGTFLRSRIFIGNSTIDSGPSGLAASVLLAENMEKKGFSFRRFKTGTPARVLSSSIDYSKLIRQDGDEMPVPFSFLNEDIGKPQVPCYLGYTTEETHEIIRRNAHLSALYSGNIEGIGARYCPSIEDKIVRFADKSRHQMFVEPEGASTEEMYLQGMSSSLPEDIQENFYKSIPGLENVRIVRSAYAIEYDCIDPCGLSLSLQYKGIEGLFFAGQINGTSGYEEAAAQGIMAGINACMYLDGKSPFVIDRSEGYIGVLIDDLITKGTNEPYRIMTSRAEYRLLLRQDNADIRLTERSYALGLAGEVRYRKFLESKEAVKKELARLSGVMISPSAANDMLSNLGSTPLSGGISLRELLKRPELSYENTAELDPGRPSLSYHVRTKVEVEIKYAGYIDKQLSQVEKFKRLEKKTLPEDIDYLSIQGIRIEARQKLDRQRPVSVGQASRISGVSPADINVLLVYLEKTARENRKRQKGEGSVDDVR